MENDIIHGVTKITATRPDGTEVTFTGTGYVKVFNKNRIGEPVVLNLEAGMRVEERVDGDAEVSEG